jgi:dipeptidyl aminopeptidase/acylaminoacyl peptidase
MCVDPLRTQITPVIFAFLVVGLFVACKPVTPPTQISPINIPVVSIPGSPTAPGVTVTPVAPGLVRSTATPKWVFTSIPTPSHTTTITSASTASETPAPSPTVTQAVIWGSGIPEPVILDQFWGQWLPREQILVGNNLAAADFGEVTLAEGPRFAVEAVQPGPRAALGNVFTASPNGRWVVYGSVPLAEYDPGWTEYSTLTRLNSQDGRVETLLVGDGRLQWLSFPGWLDGNTLAITDHSGDGFYRHSLVDVSNGSVVARSQARGPAWSPNSTYLPVAEENGGPYRLFVLTRSPQAEPYLTISGANLYARGFPPDYIAPDMSVLFRDWLPGTNRTLVQAFVYNRTTLSTTHSMLMLWDIDARVVQVLVYAALDGCYSPDGRLLAFVTLGSAPLYPDGTPSFDLGLQIPMIQSVYLQLMDSNSRQVLFSLPVVTTLDRSSRYVLDVYDTPLVFSANGRYLAFLTPGLLVSDQTGKLVVLPVDQESAPYLSVLDLHTFQPLLSTPTGAFKDFYFSAHSDQLAFLGKEGNWYLLRLVNSQVQALTVARGERLRWNGWSFDGAYFSLYEPVAEGLGRTLIFGPFR